MEIPPPSRRNPAVPPEIDHLVMTALARDPDQRWQHATALRAALTTTTQQLRLEAVNHEVVQWVTWVYEQTKKNVYALPVHDAPTMSGSTTDATDSTDATDATDTLTSNDMSPLIEIIAEAAAPIVTRLEPAQAITESPASIRGNYRRHAELAPNGAFLAEDVLPTHVRPSNPKISLPPSSSSTAITTPRETPAPRPQPPAPVRAPKPGHGSGFVLLAMLLTAVATVAVVYFALL